ncbi:hypothetical protein [Pseudodesulfovibrio sp. JC047]|uniref:hypothetical protein n=1 Tax=Pseudodesulfovibrio sp. JC047 TaxID=2683199 RepID=UPI001EF3807D|nr:hypothetical protein [Pseudodesulfovibrio sp. JC047]
MAIQEKRNPWQVDHSGGVAGVQFPFIRPCTSLLGISRLCTGLVLDIRSSRTILSTVDRCTQSISATSRSV